MNVIYLDTFARVIPNRTNLEVFNEAMSIHQLGDEVVERLIWIEENDPGYYWWEDKQLMQLFEDLYVSGCILLPRDPVDRLRWSALLCVEFSKIYEFTCGNVVLPPDYLPDEQISTWEEYYGSDVIETIISVRKELREKGWDAVFGK